MGNASNNEFLTIVEPILNNKEFCQLKEIPHHGITRYEHSFRVAYYTYILTRKLHLNYREATRGALLHDFFTSEVANEKAWQRLKMHPQYAVLNSLKYFSLTKMEVNIIATHMFPITPKPPKYIESILVNLLDNYSATKERCQSLQLTLKYITTIVFLLIVNYFH